MLFLLLFVFKKKLVFVVWTAIVMLFFCCFVLFDQNPWLACYVPLGGGQFGLFYRQAVAPCRAHWFELAPGGHF